MSFVCLQNETNQYFSAININKYAIFIFRVYLHFYLASFSVESGYICGSLIKIIIGVFSLNHRNSVCRIDSTGASIYDGTISEPQKRSMNRTHASVYVCNADEKCKRVSLTVSVLSSADKCLETQSAHMISSATPYHHNLLAPNSTVFFLSLLYRYKIISAAFHLPVYIFIFIFLGLVLSNLLHLLFKHILISHCESYHALSFDTIIINNLDVC